MATKKRVAKAAAAAAKAAAQNLKKRKVPWEEDGTLDVLLEWITTEGNYAEHCGANGNKGKTKTQHHKELAILIKERKEDSDRNEKDVENKITALERQFRLASDWANNTGQGVDNPGDFEEAVRKRCPLFKELEPIMGDRPNAKPLATSEDAELGANMLDDEDEELSAVADCAVIHSVNNNNQLDDEETPPKNTPSTLTSSSGGSSNRRMTAGRAKKPKKNSNNNVDDVLRAHLGMDDEEEKTDSFKQLRVREVVAREQEASARMIEAQAASEKADSESTTLSIQAKATLLRERKKLLEEGVSQGDIDSLLPLEK